MPQLRDLSEPLDWLAPTDISRAPPIVTMDKVSKKLSEAKEDVVTAYQTDANVNRVKRWAGPIARRTPSAAAEYLYEKFPIIQWLPRYNPKWLLNDFVAGITVGVMFVPQGISYAKIATIPVVHGLYSAWIPSLLYLFMGTSKGE